MHLNSRAILTVCKKLSLLECNLFCPGHGQFFSKESGANILRPEGFDLRSKVKLGADGRLGKIAKMCFHHKEILKSVHAMQIGC